MSTPKRTPPPPPNIDVLTGYLATDNDGASIFYYSESLADARKEAEHAAVRLGRSHDAYSVATIVNPESDHELLITLTGDVYVPDEDRPLACAWRLARLELAP